MTGMAVLQYGNLRIDPNERRVYVNEQVVELTTMEFNILYYLALHFGSGRIHFGISSSAKISSSHCKVLILKSIVRDALE